MNAKSWSVSLGATPCEHALERGIAVDEVVLEGRGHMQGHDARQAPGQHLVHDLEQRREFIVLGDQVRQLAAQA